jgi:hypothetical protein
VHPRLNGRFERRAREALAEIIRLYGEAIADDRQKLEGLLRDFCGDLHKEIRAILTACDETARDELRTASDPPSLRRARQRLIHGMIERHPVAPDAAEWAVSTWAYALGISMPREEKRAASSDVADDVEPPDDVEPFHAPHFFTRIARSRLGKLLQRAANWLRPVADATASTSWLIGELALMVVEHTAAVPQRIDAFRASRRRRQAERAGAGAELFAARMDEGEARALLPRSLDDRLSGFSWFRGLVGAFALAVCAFLAAQTKAYLAATGWGLLCTLLALGATSGARQMSFELTHPTSKAHARHRVAAGLLVLGVGLGLIGFIGFRRWRDAPPLDPIALTAIAAAVWFGTVALGAICIALFFSTNRSGKNLIGTLLLVGIVFASGFALFRIGKTEYGRYSSRARFRHAIPLVRNAATRTFFQTRPRMRIRWLLVGAATDDVDTYDVAIRAARLGRSLGHRRFWKRGVRYHSAVWPLRPGSTYCFRVRGRSRRWGISHWSHDRCFARAVDDRGLRHSGRWRTRRRAVFYEGTASATRTRGATLTLAVAGRRFALIATTCPTCGSVTASIGRLHLAAVSLRTPRTHNLVVVPLERGKLRRGVLRITALRTGRPVRIDGVGVSRVG